ncbi:MAG: deoxyribose-phosphate aldolase [Clostridia bacterium]|nr:deoxyribose-phosphate aldolase [Clostridia bacterium]
MEKKTIASMIDHAVLKPEASDKDLKRECEIAARYKVASVCVKPSHVTLAGECLKGTGVKVSTVIGFPHGSATTFCKAAEARESIQNGAEELDMVINIGKLLSGDFDYVRQDIKEVVDIAHEKGALLKVIIETSLLSDEMKVTACKLAEEAGADYVKTSTGFNGGGATLEDVLLMRKSVSDKVKVKASGGIKNFDQAAAFIDAGCLRLGTSATEQILSGFSAGMNLGQDAY